MKVSDCLRDLDRYRKNNCYDLRKASAQELENAFDNATDEDKFFVEEDDDDYAKASVGSSWSDICHTLSVSASRAIPYYDVSDEIVDEGPAKIKMTAEELKRLIYIEMAKMSAYPDVIDEGAVDDATDSFIAESIEETITKAEIDETGTLNLTNRKGQTAKVKVDDLVDSPMQEIHKKSLLEQEMESEMIL